MTTVIFYDTITPGDTAFDNTDATTDCSNAQCYTLEAGASSWVRTSCDIAAGGIGLGFTGATAGGTVSAPAFGLLELALFMMVNVVFGVVSLLQRK